MNYTIEIKQISDDGLKRSSWIFVNINKMEMTLEVIRHQHRLTKKHKWKTCGYWDRSLKSACTIQREEPPQWVKKKLGRRILNDIKFS